MALKILLRVVQLGWVIGSSLLAFQEVVLTKSKGWARKGVSNSPAEGVRSGLKKADVVWPMAVSTVVARVEEKSSSSLI